MTKEKNKKVPMTKRHQDRRRRAILLLERQLASGHKPRKVRRDGIGEDPWIPLTETDVNRINNQIAILKSRITTY